MLSDIEHFCIIFSLTSGDYFFWVCGVRRQDGQTRNQFSTPQNRGLKWFLLLPHQIPYGNPPQYAGISFSEPHFKHWRGTNNVTSGLEKESVVHCSKHILSIPLGTGSSMLSKEPILISHMGMSS